MHNTMIIRDRETGQALAEIDSATVARNKLLPHLEAVTPLRHLQDTRAALAAREVPHANR